MTLPVMERAPINMTAQGLKWVGVFTPIVMALLAIICLVIYLQARAPGVSKRLVSTNAEKPLAPLNITNPSAAATGPKQALSELNKPSENTPARGLADATQLWQQLGSSLQTEVPASKPAPAAQPLDVTGLRSLGTDWQPNTTPQRAPVFIRNTDRSAVPALGPNLEQWRNAPAQMLPLPTTEESKHTLARAEQSLSFLLPRGSRIDCTLETAIDSTLPGLTRCVVATDVYSADGKVVLLERGSQLVGETHADVKPNQARVGVIWTDARTAQGVRFRLESPATDALGRTGLSGQVDRHSKERLEAAALLTLLETGTAAVAAHFQRGTAISVNPQTTSSVATEALKDTLQAAPTIHVASGAVVSILAVQDIDFTKVYALSVSDNPP
jgi:type IV secretion system protein VirB10